MTSQTIQILINKEIKAIPNLEKLFGHEILELFVTPKNEIYHHALNENVNFEFWTILEDHENRKRVFYISEENYFGLGAENNKNMLINLGFYGSLIEMISLL